jgi:hypothetical protein
MKRFFLVPALGAAALAFSAQAHAQQLGTIAESTLSAYAADARQPYYESRRAAYDNGYREGLTEGERAGSRRETPRYENTRTWQRADKGYNRSYGELERYRQQFRVGFSEGYQAGYARYGVNGNGNNGRAVPRQDTYGYPGGYGTSYPGGYGNSYPDRSRAPYYGGQAGYGYSAAYPNGVNDGLAKGREDAQKRRSFDPLRHDWYREGTRHYKSEYGPKQQYASVYREAFREGYDRGYRELGFVR